MYLMVSDGEHGRTVLFMVQRLDCPGVTCEGFKRLIDRLSEYGTRSYPQLGPRMAVLFDIRTSRVKFFKTIADVDCAVARELLELTVEHFLSIPEEAWARMVEPVDVVHWALQNKWLEAMPFVKPGSATL